MKVFAVLLSMLISFSAFSQNKWSITANRTIGLEVYYSDPVYEPIGKSRVLSVFHSVHVEYRFNQKWSADFGLIFFQDYNHRMVEPLDKSQNSFRNDFLGPYFGVKYSFYQTTGAKYYVSGGFSYLLLYGQDLPGDYKKVFQLQIKDANRHMFQTGVGVEIPLARIKNESGIFLNVQFSSTYFASQFRNQNGRYQYFQIMAGVGLSYQF